MAAWSISTGTASVRGDRVAVTNTATPIRGENPRRKTLVLQNSGDVACHVGAANVAADSGFALAPGAAIVLGQADGAAGAWSAITASGSTTVDYIETF
jgi:hypothetical protein